MGPGSFNFLVNLGEATDDSSSFLVFFKNVIYFNFILNSRIVNMPQILLDST